MLSVAPFSVPTGWAQVRLIEAVSGLAAPVFVTHAPGTPDRLYILEQGNGGTAQIKVHNRLTGSTSTFMTLTGLSTGGERGLLGLAFHPGYETNKYFYTYTSVPAASGGNHDTWVRRFTATDADTTSSTTGVSVIRFSQDFGNHNGGWLGFGPQGYLHVSTGDGGSGGDPNNRSQNLCSMLGKILRLDVNVAGSGYAIPADNPFVTHPPGLPEIWAYGLRNPWRCSFDRMTHDFIIGDVGQNVREEISFQKAFTPGGRNYGWKIREGFSCFDNNPDIYTPGACIPGLLTNATCAASFTEPLHDYVHSLGGPKASVTGGYVYRGPSPSLQGRYFFADYEDGFVWSMEIDRNAETMVANSLTDHTAILNNSVSPNLDGITAFGEDTEGNLYIAEVNKSNGAGRVFLLTAEAGRSQTRIESGGGSNEVCIHISNLTPDRTNTLEETSNLSDTNGWQHVSTFLTTLGETHYCIPSDTNAASFRVRTQ